LDVIQSAMLDPDPQVILAAKKVINQVILKIEYLIDDLATNNKRRYLETEKIIETFGMITVEPLIRALDNYLEISEEERNLVDSGFHLAQIRVEEGSRTRALSEMHSLTAERVADLLQKITGNYFGLNILAWRQWWQENKSDYFQPYIIEE